MDFRAIAKREELLRGKDIAAQARVSSPRITYMVHSDTTTSSGGTIGRPPGYTGKVMVRTFSRWAVAGERLASAGALALAEGHLGQEEKAVAFSGGAT